MLIKNEAEYDLAVAELDALLEASLALDEPRINELSDALRDYDDKHWHMGDLEC